MKLGKYTVPTGNRTPGRRVAVHYATTAPRKLHSDRLINPLYCFFGSEGHEALDRNPGPGYDTLLLRLIPGDLLSECPHRQFHTPPGLLDSRVALPNTCPNTLRAMQGGSLYHF